MNFRKWIILIFILAFSLSLIPDIQEKKYNFLKGSLVGVVYDEAGRTISKAEVIVKGTDYEDTFRTDGQGRFSIKKMPTGVYKLSLLASNPNSTVIKDVAIHLGKETYVSLVSKTQSVLDESGYLGPKFFRDSQGKIFHQETNLGDRIYSVDYTYDAKGRMSSFRDSFDQEWKYEYTASGKIRKVIRPDKKNIYYNYDKDDELARIDLPWGYKIHYEKSGNQFIKTISKYKNQVLYRYVYSIDSKGNKTKVEEGSDNKSSFEYIYDGSDNLKSIVNSRTGETNVNVVEYKGKVKNRSIDGLIEAKNGKYQDRQYEYAFDERGNIIRQKAIREDLEVQKRYNARDLMIGEIFLFKNVPAFAVEYLYDTSDRLIMKTINNRIRYYYFRDQDGHVVQKSVKNLSSGEEKTAIFYTPFHSDFDQDGFELVKYEKNEKLFVRDAEGNSRFMINMQDVMKHKIVILERQVNMDGDYWGSTESLLSLAEARLRRPFEIVGKYCVDFYDLPLNDTDPLGEEDFTSIQTKKIVFDAKSERQIWPGVSIGCWGVPMAVQKVAAAKENVSFYGCDYDWFDYCVDCYEGYIGDDLGGAGYDCYAGISGPGQLDVNQEGTFFLDTDCNNPSAIYWFGQWANGLDYGSYYTASWDEYCAEQYMEVGVSFSTSSNYTFTDMYGQHFYYYDVVGKEAYTYVFIHDPDPPQDVIVFEMGGGEVGGNYASVKSSEFSGNNSFIIGQSFHSWIRTATFNGQDCSWSGYWSGYGNSGNISPGSGSGKDFYCTPNPSPAPNGRSGPLWYTILVEIIFPNGERRSGQVTFEQDVIDKLRQEYLDLPGRPWVPMRSEFDQDSPYHTGLLGTAAHSSEHEYWHILRSLNAYAADSDSFYFMQYAGNGINYTSGFRCPRGNEETYGHEDDSYHQYGRAFDFVQGSHQSNLNVAWVCYYIEWFRVILKEEGEDAPYYLYPDIPENVNLHQGHAQW